MAALDRADIQGDILRAYGNAYDCTTYVFVTVSDPAGGRAWLRGLVDGVTSDAERTDKPPCHTNLAFTYTGLQALGVPGTALEGFSEEFEEGMAGRAGVLGDTGASAPGNWQGDLGTGQAHVLVTLNALDVTVRDEALGTLEAGVEAADGVAVLYRQHAKLLPDSREHFGFADGFAQPAIEGVSENKTRGGGLAQKDGGWRPLKLGEFILGHMDEDSLGDETRLPPAPAAPLGRNGTYMVWRKLHQDVALFRRTVGKAAEGYEGGEAKLRAKIVGRWENGVPLVLSPNVPDAHVHERPSNDFRYQDDPDGRRCPLGAHIRRSNPRDAIVEDGRLTFRHRIIRRGMPYGEPLPDGVTADDEQERGLVFVCFNASISRQFEGIQVQWLNDGNIFHLGHDKDYLLGDSATTAKMTVQGDPPHFVTPQPSFVTTRGGEYLFVPGMTALAAIADGSAG